MFDKAFVVRDEDGLKQMEDVLAGSTTATRRSASRTRAACTTPT